MIEKGAIKLYTSKWCNTEINGSPMKWKEVYMEFKELLEARSLYEIKEELSDTIYCLLCAIHTYTNISLPMLGAYPTIQKLLIRQLVWQQIFSKEMLVFDKKYLVNGSNFNKPTKVEKALQLAKLDQKGD